MDRPKKVVASIPSYYFYLSLFHSPGFETYGGTAVILKEPATSFRALPLTSTFQPCSRRNKRITQFLEPVKDVFSICSGRSRGNVAAYIKDDEHSRSVVAQQYNSSSSAPLSRQWMVLSLLGEQLKVEAERHVRLASDGQRLPSLWQTDK